MADTKNRRSAEDQIVAIIRDVRATRATVDAMIDALRRWENGEDYEDARTVQERRAAIHVVAD